VASNCPIRTVDPDFAFHLMSPPLFGAFISFRSISGHPYWSEDMLLLSFLQVDLLE
jgi:hypothetical protein